MGAQQLCWRRGPFCSPSGFGKMSDQKEAGLEASLWDGDSAQVLLQQQIWLWTLEVLGIKSLHKKLYRHKGEQGQGTGWDAGVETCFQQLEQGKRQEGTELSLRGTSALQRCLVISCHFEVNAWLRFILKKYAVLYRNGNISFRRVIKSEADEREDWKTTVDLPQVQSSVHSAKWRVEKRDTWGKAKRVFKTLLVFISRVLQTDSTYLLSCERSVRKEENRICAVVFYHKKCNSTPKL